jgi:hypothetical protein
VFLSRFMDTLHFAPELMCVAEVPASRIEGSVVSGPGYSVVSEFLEFSVWSICTIILVNQKQSRAKGIFLKGASILYG